MDSSDPSLFIGSSTEGLSIAHALQAELDEDCEPLVWHQDVFGPTGTTISSLVGAARNSDFAALVLTPDDTLVIRGVKKNVARANVIFELGLFLGALGSERVFIVHPRNQDLQMPTDLAGVTCLTYNGNRKDRNLQAAIGPAATAIRNRISNTGIRSHGSLQKS